ncbi:MAG: hypothetical protein QXI22_04155 [Sulfolobales archaeon]
MNDVCIDSNGLEDLLRVTLENIEALERAVREVEEDLRRIYEAQGRARSCIERNA